MESAWYKQARTRDRISGQTRGKVSAKLAGPMLSCFKIVYIINYCTCCLPLVPEGFFLFEGDGI